MSKNIYGTRGDLFTSVQTGQVKRSGFDLSHDVKMSFDMGNLTPCFCQEVLPGDKWNVNQQIMLRFAPLVAPVMQKMDCYTHFFKVPYRLLMNAGDFDAFITGGEKGDGKNDAGEVVTLPHFKLSQIINYLESVESDANVAEILAEIFTAGGLWDYLGFPTLPETKDYYVTHDDDEKNEAFLAQLKYQFDKRDISLSLFPFRAYFKIYNEYYRDQNLVNKLTEFTDLGAASEMELLQIIKICSPFARYLLSSGDLNFDFYIVENRCLPRAWKKDYFTSSLPFAQKGEEVTIGLAGSAPVRGWAKLNDPLLGVEQVAGVRDPHLYAVTSGTAQRPVQFVNDSVDPDNPHSVESRITSISGRINDNRLEADLSQASAVTIEQLRTAEAVQMWLEKIARVGARYTEMLQGFFGVTPRDSRLQRPEYLGGGKTAVIVSEVMQTSADSEENKLGDMAGHAVSVGNFHGFNTFVEEYGMILGIMSVLPASCYMQGVSRILRGDRSREDMYFPQFAHLGEQDVLNQEVYFDLLTSDDPKGTFGYQSRFAEYKYIPDRVHGDFKNSLDTWHLARKFDSAPGLDGEFISCTPSECNRIFNVVDPNINHLWCENYFDCKVIRCMPKYGTPAFGL